MMEKNTKWLLAVAGVACAGGAAAWLSQAPESNDVEDAATLSERDVPSVALGERAAGCDFEVGDKLAYQLSSHDRASLDLSGLGAPTDGAPSDVDVSTRARLELRAIGVEDDSAVLLGRFGDVSSDTVVDEAKLREPFLIRVGSDCAIDGFAHLKGVKPGYARVQQALVHELSWMWPNEGTGSYDGRNTNGSFVASVSVADSSVNQTIKSFEPWSRGPGSLDRVVDSFQQVKPGSRAWFQSLEARAELSGPRAKVEHSVTANWIGDDVSSLEGASTDESDYVWADLLPTEIPLAERQPPTKQELMALAEARKLTVDQAVNQYVARATDPNVGIQDTWPELRTFLEAKPEAAAEVVEKLKRAEMPSEATMGAYIALGNARTPEAKAALEGVMRDANAPVIERSRAILALIDRDDVGVELASYLGDKSTHLAGDTKGDRVLARQSLLALGAMSGRKAYDEELKAMALGEIAQRLDETRSMSEAFQRPVFGALANVGDPDSLGLVAHIPDHPDPDVREAAAIVFRRMPPAKSAEFAARWLAVETNPNVKRKLWHTMELQTFDAHENYPVEVLQYAVRDLREKPGPITRKALVRMLARAKAEMPEDTLDIEDLFVELMPYEYDQNSGFEKFMHDAISPERRDALYMEIAQKFEAKGDSGTSGQGSNGPGVSIPQVPGAGEVAQ